MTRAEMSAAQTAANEALKARLEGHRASATAATPGPVRDGRGKVVQFHEPSYGTPGNAQPTADAVVPPMGHLTGRTCQSVGAPMNFAVPVSICKLVSAAPSSTSPLGAEIASLKARLAALEGGGGVVATPAPAKPVQPASEQRPEGVFEAADYQRYAEAKAVSAARPPTTYSYHSYGR